MNEFKKNYEKICNYIKHLVHNNKIIDENYIFNLIIDYCKYSNIKINEIDIKELINIEINQFKIKQQNRIYEKEFQFKNILNEPDEFNCFENNIFDI
ncbi:MAG: hypothetical protein IKY10_02325 [Clostridia bacterium]|nr:hypothetical protein [Clostridia bacterium]